eukprot:2481682-Prymnesium_polylepis.1
MREASRRVGMNEATQADLYAVLAAVMHMSNADFVAARGGNDDGVEVKDSSVVLRASSLIGSADLSPLLLTRTVLIMSDAVTIQLTAAQAVAAVSAFCKAVYSLLFEWIVSRINESIRGEAAESMNSIGLLDVFGFEVFDTNSFEQLCINYANERLHQFFLKYVFKMEEQIYAAECIMGVKIEYQDNQATIDLIEKAPMGLFPLLDSTCKTPKATDDLFCTNIYEQHSKNACLVVPKRRPPNGKDTTFTVAHFAGHV